MRGNFADGDYQSLQVQVNRRYIRGVQFGAAYTLQRARGVADEDPGNLSIYAPIARSTSSTRELAQSNRHSLIINYSWDLPGPPHRRDARCCSTAGRCRARTTSSPATGPTSSMTTTDNFDFTGGEAGNGACLGGNEPCLHLVRPVLIGDPMAGGGNPLTGFFNTAAFARPARGDYGNTPRNVVKKPGVDQHQLRGVQERRLRRHAGASQFRAEIYNLFNQVEFQDIDRTARFDATGAQINPNFGTAIGIASPTRPPRVDPIVGADQLLRTHMTDTHSRLRSCSSCGWPRPRA